MIFNETIFKRSKPNPEQIKLFRAGVRLFNLMPVRSYHRRECGLVIGRQNTGASSWGN